MLRPILPKVNRVTHPKTGLYRRAIRDESIACGYTAESPDGRACETCRHLDRGQWQWEPGGMQCFCAELVHWVALTGHCRKYASRFATRRPWWARAVNKIWSIISNGKAVSTRRAK